MPLDKWYDFPHCTVPVVRARVQEIVNRAEGPRVLEVGCNEGFVAKALIEKGLEVVAVDNRKEARDAALQTFGIEAVNADINALPYADGEFDTVIGAEILEHLPNPGKGLAELFRVASKQVIITVPVGSYWNGELTHAWQLNGSSIEHDHGVVKPHVKEVFVIEFRKIRQLVGGSYENVHEGHGDR
jgi:ubiquinone/menaquinone biosynthesis C-methylase UbiE